MKEDFKETINKLISEIEIGLLEGKIHSSAPEVALNYQSKLTSYLSTIIGFLEVLEISEAEYFVNNRHTGEFKSDNATRKSWDITEKGMKQKFWETRKDRLKELIKILEKIYYHGRDEAKHYKELK